MTFFSSRKSTEDTLSQETTPPYASLSAQPIGFETVLGANCVIEGTLSSSGNVRLDGTFAGTLDIKGNVLIGETAKITADVDAHNISIAGAVRGNVTGNKVQILRTGRVWGDINVKALTTEEGAFIDGKITMRGHAVNQPAIEEVAPPAKDAPPATTRDEDETMAARPDLPIPTADQEDGND